MGRFVKGDVVVVPFPFSDLSHAKRRPALVLAALQGGDFILTQITSQAVRDTYALPIRSPDFAAGDLRRPSNIRPNRLFTADDKLILYRLGALRPEKTAEVAEAVIRILRA